MIIITAKPTATYLFLIKHISVSIWFFSLTLIYPTKRYKKGTIANDVVA
jgi:hypothetical protein